jgi:CxxC motif-containing protein (DUF1111 family)
VSAIRQRADPADADGDGISGRLPTREDCAGRFGWQSVSCDVPAFVRSALLHEIGIVTLPRSRREISDREFDDLVAFVRQLPPPGPPHSDDGLDLFQRVGCASCHVPSMTTVDAAGSGPKVQAFTDLLLREMGSGPRHRNQDSRTEFRTPPLWGIGAAGPPYLHDGSARTLDEAIRRHGGEATASRRRFLQLSSSERQRLVHFVATR